MRAEFRPLVLCVLLLAARTLLASTCCQEPGTPRTAPAVDRVPTTAGDAFLSESTACAPRPERIGDHGTGCPCCDSGDCGSATNGCPGCGGSPAGSALLSIRARWALPATCPLVAWRWALAPPTSVSPPLAPPPRS